MRTPASLSRLMPTPGAFGKQRNSHWHTGGTPPKRCTQMVSAGGSAILCEHRIHRAGRCVDHYNDWRAGCDARRRGGAIAVNPRRRALNAVCREHGLTSGRQKRSLRKALRRLEVARG